MADEPQAQPAETIESLCRRHRVHELAAFGPAGLGDSNQTAALNLLVEFEAHVQVGFAELMDLQDAFAALLGRQVFLVPKANLGSPARAQAEAQARIVYPPKDHGESS